MKLEKEKVHSWVLLVSVVVNCLLVLFTEKYQKLGLLFITGIVFLFYAGLEIQTFVKTAFRILLFSAGYLIFFIIYSEANFDQAVFISVRLLVVSTLSLCSLNVISSERSLIYLCQKKIIPKMWSYPLLLALGSGPLFKKQFELAKLNAQLRQIKGWALPQVLFQFIVFAISFSEKATASLVTRHLSEEKYFYYDLSINKKDQCLLVFFTFLCIALFII